MKFWILTFVQNVEFCPSMASEMNLNFRAKNKNIRYDDFFKDVIDVILIAQLYIFAIF